MVLLPYLDKSDSYLQSHLASVPAQSVSAVTVAGS